MHTAVSFLLVLVATVATYADPQYAYLYPAPHPYDAAYPEPNYFRANLPSSSIEAQKPEDRLFFGTATLTLATTTTTSTITVSTTCTTSTAAQSICSPSGRRRRGFVLNDNKKSRGLFYNDQEEDVSSIFIREPENKEVAVIESENSAVERVERSTLTMVPFVVQPGFNAPEGTRGGRFLVAFGTSTVTSTTSSTYTAVLTATCKSTTGFLTCTGNGKK